jgi:hypothetical protein
VFYKKPFPKSPNNLGRETGGHPQQKRHHQIYPGAKTQKIKPGVEKYLFIPLVK